MSNKLLEMFDWAMTPGSVDAPQTADEHALTEAQAPIASPPHTSRWTKQRLIVLARRAIMVLLLSVCLFLGVFGYVWSVTPSTADLGSLAHAQVLAHRGQYTSQLAIAPQLAQAVVAIEDEHFYQHHGIDTLGLARAAWDDLRAGRLVEGGSTITAQLAKLVYLNGYDHTIPLKAQDLVLALKIERHYNKGQILEMYLNVAYYGENAYGIGAAAQHYFGVAPAKLDLAQVALLAGMLQAPGAYDPWCHIAPARARQQAVLARMVLDGYINHSQASAAAQQVLPFLGAGPACGLRCVMAQPILQVERPRFSRYC